MNTSRRFLALGSTNMPRRRPAAATCTSLKTTKRSIAATRSSSTWHPQERYDVMTAIGTDEDVRGQMSYSLSYAVLDEYNSFPPLTRSLYPREQEQLRISRDQLRRTITTTTTTSSLPPPTSSSLTMHLKKAQQRKTNKSCNDEELPRTLQDALRPSTRAIVVTESTMPFNVVDVNKAWEELCGYTYTESHGRSLGSLLKGPQTDPVTVTALINQLLRGEDATAVITNYKKNGQPFRNRLRVGPLYSTTNGHSSSKRDHREISHFVGILEEVAENVVPRWHTQKLSSWE
jgi:PAS domain S-box-containing protein